MMAPVPAPALHLALCFRDRLVQIPLPRLIDVLTGNRIATYLSNAERTERRLVFKAVPAFKQDHSVAVALPENKGIKSQLLDFRAKFLQLGQKHFFTR